MPRTIIFSRAQPRMRFSLGAEQLKCLSGCPPPKQPGGAIEVDVPVAYLRLAISLARGKDPGPPADASVVEFCEFVLGKLQFTGKRPWLSKCLAQNCWLLTANAQLYRFTPHSPDALPWTHPELTPLLRPINNQVALVELPKPVRQFLVPEEEDGALAVLYMDGTVMALTIWGGYDEILDEDGLCVESGEVEYTEGFGRVEYDTHQVLSMRFVFPELRLQTADVEEEYILIVPSGEEQY